MPYTRRVCLIDAKARAQRGVNASARGVPEAISVPLLALIPQMDGLVDSKATRRFVARIPGGETVEYPGAGHELLREAEPLRSTVLARMLAFFDGQ